MAVLDSVSRLANVHARTVLPNMRRPQLKQIDTSWLLAWYPIGHRVCGIKTLVTIFCLTHSA